MLASLQVLKPAYSVPCTWSRDSLKLSLAATLLRLHNASVTATELEEDEDDSCPLSAPAFAYCFPLLRAAMLLHIEQEEVKYPTTCLIHPGSFVLFPTSYMLFSGVGPGPGHHSRAHRPTGQRRPLRG